MSNANSSNINVPDSQFYPPSIIDHFARQISPTGTQGLARAAAIRLGLSAVPPGLSELCEAIATHGATCAARLPDFAADAIGDLCRELATHGLDMRVGRYAVRFRVGR